MTDVWDEGRYVVTPYGDHRVVAGQSGSTVWVLSLDHEHAESFEASELCTADEWAAENGHA